MIEQHVDATADFCDGKLLRERHLDLEEILECPQPFRIRGIAGQTSTTCRSERAARKLVERAGDLAANRTRQHLPDLYSLQGHADDRQVSHVYRDDIELYARDGSGTE